MKPLLSKMLSARRYLAVVLALFILLFGGTVAFNYLADPFDIYHFDISSKSVRNLSSVLTLFYLHKTHAVQKARADVLLVGNSRMLYGLDPAHPGLPEQTYNLGVEAFKMYECWRYCQQAAAAHVPKTVILGLDAKMFTEDGWIHPQFAEARMSVTSDGKPQPLAFLYDTAPTLASVTGLYYSLKTLRPSEPRPFDRGFPVDGLVKRLHLDLAQGVFASNEETLAPYTQRYRDRDGKTPQMDAFRRLAAFCAKNHIHLIAYFHPLHASLTDLVTADWDGYQQWVQTVVGALDATPGLQWDCWDFIGYNTMSTEPFPKPGDTYNHMRFYSEASHYRRNVGGLVLDRVLGLGGGGHDDFGRRITPATAQADLDRLRREQEDWHQRGKTAPVREAELLPDDLPAN